MSLINDNNLSLYSQGVDKRFKTIENSIKNVKNAQDELLSNTIIYDPNDSNMRQYDIDLLQYISSSNSLSTFASLIPSNLSISTLSTESESVESRYIYRYVSDIILYPTLISSVYVTMDSSIFEYIGVPNINDVITQDGTAFTNVGDNIVKIDIEDTSLLYSGQIIYANNIYCYNIEIFNYICTYCENVILDGILLPKRGLYVCDIVNGSYQTTVNKIVLSSNLALPRFATATNIIKQG